MHHDTCDASAPLSHLATAGLLTRPPGFASATSLAVRPQAARVLVSAPRPTSTLTTSSRACKLACQSGVFVHVHVCIGECECERTYACTQLSDSQLNSTRPGEHHQDRLPALRHQAEHLQYLNGRCARLGAAACSLHVVRGIGFCALWWPSRPLTRTPYRSRLLR